MNFYNDDWFWRASDQAAVAEHLMDRSSTAREPYETPHASTARTFLLTLLGMAGLAGWPDEVRTAEGPPARQGCACGNDDDFGYREPVHDEGGWVLRCPECGHLDRLEWLSAEARPLVLGLARRRRLLRTRKAARS